MTSPFTDHAEGATPLRPVTKAAFTTWKDSATPSERRWLDTTGFSAETGSLAFLPGKAGGLKRVLLGLGDGSDPWAFGAPSKALPSGTYRYEGLRGADKSRWAALAWGLGAYTFTRYKTAATPKTPAVLVWPKGVDPTEITRLVEATHLVRDLINTPAEDMGPSELVNAAKDLATRYGAGLNIIDGLDLERGFPAIHAVGKGSPRAPRLIDLTWGRADAPKLTLVGKGVCFDSGGLGLKPDTAMKLMKKDMGGAAHVLGLARMILDAQLPVRLRVLIPAVENAVSGNAMRPLDIIRTRRGTTVEIGHTDAEGRLILADALTLAGEDHPDLVVDLATLTGAARTALGTDIPPLFTNDEALARDLLAAAKAENDPLWRLPLWAPYRSLLDSTTADISNVSDAPFAGAITAALFLKEFAAESRAWVHLDVYAWNKSGRAGRPEGGEAQGLRALFSLLRRRYEK